MKNKKTPKFTRAVLLQAMAGPFTKRGGEIVTILRRNGISERALSEPDFPIEAFSCYQAMEDMAAELGDPFFGSEIARLAALQGTPTLRDSAAAARTLGEFLMRSVLETGQQFNNVVYSLCVKATLATFEIERQRRGSRPTTQADAIGVAFYVTILRECLGEAFDTKQIIVSAFSFDGLPRDFLPPHSLVRSSGPALSLVFPATWLFAPLNLSWAAQTCNSQKSKTEPKTREPLVFLKSVIRENIATEGFDLPSLAASCGISIRSLQRIFADQNTSFRSLTDEIRRDVAIDLVTGTATPLKDISSLIGFSAGAAFCRSYRRWTGTSPSAHRRNSSGQRGEPP